MVSMDALFGLCRKRSAGVSEREPLFKDIFFENQVKVYAFVSTYSSTYTVHDKVLVNILIVFVIHNFLCRVVMNFLQVMLCALSHALQHWMKQECLEAFVVISFLNTF